jgi:hypothetical protein
MKIGKLYSILRIRKREKEESSIFAIEIHSRNGFDTVSQDFSGGSVGEGYFGRAFFMYKKSAIRA